MRFKLFFLLAIQVLCGTIYPKEKRDFLLVDTHRPQAGFFAIYLLVLGHLHLYERGIYDKMEGLEINFHEGLFYDLKKGKNWWGYYFEPIVIGNQSLANKRRTHPHENARAWSTLPRKREANAIINKYIHLKSALLKKIDAFERENFKDHKIIGFHYRGTDKSTEKPRVPYDVALQYIKKVVEDFKDASWKIFVATDEAPFLEFLKSIYPGKIIHIEAFRSNDLSDTAQGIHHSNFPPFEMGEQAVMDAYLLARCDYLLRTDSNLSYCSTLINPDLKVLKVKHFYEIP